MSVEQVARDFITTMTDEEKMKAYLTADAIVSGGILPQPMPASETFNLLAAVRAALPDLKFDVQKVTVNGNQATVNVALSGTNTGTLNIPLPGMPGMIPATGKRASVSDTLIVTVEGDKVSHLHIDSPADGGLPALLAKIGIKLPGM